MHPGGGEGSTGLPSMVTALVRDVDEDLDRALNPGGTGGREVAREDNGGR